MSETGATEFKIMFAIPYERLDRMALKETFLLTKSTLRTSVRQGTKCKKKV